MFQQYTDYFWGAFFAALVFYTVWRIFGVPLLLKRFYLQHGFTDQGRSTLEDAPYSDSRLLNDLHAARVYVGVYRHYRCEQFAAYPQERGKRTFNRAQRKKNQALWTITLLHSDEPLAPFCARPTRAADALEYLLDLENVAFPNDEAFTKRVHVVAEDHALVCQLFSPSIKAHLNNIDPISLESVARLLVLKSPRQPHDVGSKMKIELDAMVSLYESLR